MPDKTAQAVDPTKPDKSVEEHQQNGKGVLRFVGKPQDHARKEAETVQKDLDTTLTQLTDGWAALNQQAKIEAIRAGVVIALKAVRWLMLK